MKKRLIIFLSFLLLMIIILFLYMNSQLKLKQKQKYVNYINNILPNISEGNMTIITERENIARISQCVITYYKACANKNIDLLKSILNKEYINNMNIDTNDVIITNINKIKVSDMNIDTVYKIDENIYFITVKDLSNNICFVGIVLNEDKTKYSIFLDGVYNYNDIKRYEFEKEYEDYEEGQVEDAV